MHRRPPQLLVIVAALALAGCLQEEAPGGAEECAQASVYLRAWAGNTDPHNYHMVLRDAEGSLHEVNGVVDKDDTPNPQIHDPFEVAIGQAQVNATDGTVQGAKTFQTNCLPTYVNVTFTAMEVQFNVVQPDV